MITSSQLYELANRLETHEYEVSELQEENESLERENRALADEIERFQAIFREIGLDPDAQYSLSDCNDIRIAVMSADLRAGLKW